MDDNLEHLIKSFEEMNNRKITDNELERLKSILPLFKVLSDGKFIPDAIFKEIEPCGECIGCLNHALEDALEIEDYLEAAKLRDKIKILNTKNSI